MPVLDGFGFIEEVQSHEDWRGVPIVVVTAKEITEDERAFLEGSTERIFHKGEGGQEDLLSDIVEALRRHA